MNNNKRSLNPEMPKILMLAALICLMAGGYFIARKKAYFREATKLPFYKIEMSDVSDGVYEGKTYTSFLHLQLRVTVENHQIKNIEILENDGLDGETARPILEKMIEKNSPIVPAVKGAETGSLVYISCVSSALHI